MSLFTKIGFGLSFLGAFLVGNDSDTPSVSESLPLLLYGTIHNKKNFQMDVFHAQTNLSTMSFYDIIRCK